MGLATIFPTELGKRARGVLTLKKKPGVCVFEGKKGLRCNRTTRKECTKRGGAWRGNRRVLCLAHERVVTLNKTVSQSDLRALYR